MPISTIGQNGLNAPLSLTLPVVATTMGVGGATPSGSGSGISFPATQSASSDANTLDDYEEGTWTPTILATTTNPSVTYTKQAGVYTKVGNLVTVNFQIVLSAISGGSGYAQIGGFPFTAGPSSSTLPSYSSGCLSETGINFTWPSGYTQIAMELTNSSTSAYITFLASAKDQAIVSIANIANGNNYFIGTLSYRIS